MAMFKFSHGIGFPKMGFDNPFTSAQRAKRQQEHINRKNVKLINEFLEQRKKLQNERTSNFARLKEQRKNKSIDSSTYHRMRELLVLSHETKRLEMLYSMARESAKEKAA
jgi:hypothetical protein